MSLQKFGGIGKSTYDKRAKQEQQRAHNAARVNAYRKLQKKLGDRLEPRVRWEVRPSPCWRLPPPSAAATGCCFQTVLLSCSALAVV